jgi:DNA-binding NtrC family response regulator
LRQLSAAIGSGYAGGLPQIELAPKSPVISLPESERQAISRALAATNGDRTRAARLLSIGRTTLYRKMKEYGFD